MSDSTALKITVSLCVTALAVAYMLRPCRYRSVTEGQRIILYDSATGAAWRYKTGEPSTASTFIAVPRE